MNAWYGCVLFIVIINLKCWNKEIALKVNVCSSNEAFCFHKKRSANKLIEDKRHFDRGVRLGSSSEKCHTNKRKFSVVVSFISFELLMFWLPIFENIHRLRKFERFNRWTNKLFRIKKLIYGAKCNHLISLWCSLPNIKDLIKHKHIRPIDIIVNVFRSTSCANPIVSNKIGA